jgi:hypothetical protein
MKRTLLLLGPIIAVSGSLGLLVTGGTLVGVFDVLTHHVADPAPASLAELPWAVMSTMGVVIGLAITCVATVLRDDGRTISTMGRLIAAAAGVFAVAAAVPVVWVIIGVKGAFSIIAMSSTAPTAEELQEMIQSARPGMMIGAALLLLAAALQAVGGAIGFQLRAPVRSGGRVAASVMSAIGSVLAGLFALLLLSSVWSHGTALESMIAGQSASPKPAELAEHLQAILNGTFLAFGMLATQGVLQIVTAIAVPSGKPPGTDL